MYWSLAGTEQCAVISLDSLFYIVCVFQLFCYTRNKKSFKIKVINTFGNVIILTVIFYSITSFSQTRILNLIFNYSYEVWISRQYNRIYKAISSKTYLQYILRICQKDRFVNDFITFFVTSTFSVQVSLSLFLTYDLSYNCR